MSATVVSSGSCDTLNCLLCFNQFINPRVLPCIHTFCEKCLGDYIISTVKNKSEKILCPVCMEKCDPPNRKIPIDKWASSFVLDELIVSIMKLEENTEESSRICGPCKSEGEEVNAAYWCLQCRDKLCAKCLRYHSRIPALKCHKTVPIEDMKASEKLELTFDQQCSCDRGDNVNVLCIDHKRMICTFCAITTHRNCKEISDLEKTGKEFSQRNMATNIMKDIGKIMSNLQKLSYNRKTTKSTFTSDIAKCIQDINDMCNEIKEEVETLQVILTTTTEELREKMETKRESNEEILLRFSRNVGNSNELFKAFNRYGNPKQKYIAYNTVISQLHSHYARLRTELEGEEDVRVSVEFNTIFEDLKIIATSLGKINTLSTPSISARNFIGEMDNLLKSMATRTRVNPAVCAAQIARVDPLRRGMIHVTSVTQREITRGTIWFTGGTYLTNGHLIMADHYNTRLVEFDTGHKMTAEYKIDGYPQDVTSHGDIVYVSVYRDDGRYIYKCLVDRGLSVAKRYKAPHGAVGLAVSNDESFVLGTLTDVQVLSQSGKNVYKIPKSADHWSYVAVSRQSPTMMYHSDGNTIVCRDLHYGTQKYRYRHDDIRNPIGMCVGDEDVLYVCCNGNVHQISPDGQRGRVVLDRLHGITKPWGVLFNPHTKEYIITSWSEDTVMEVYTLR